MLRYKILIVFPTDHDLYTHLVHMPVHIYTFLVCDESKKMWRATNQAIFNKISDSLLFKMILYIYYGSVPLNIHFSCGAAHSAHNGREDNVQLKIRIHKSRINEHNLCFKM